MSRKANVRDIIDIADHEVFMSDGGIITIEDSLAIIKELIYEEFELEANHSQLKKYVFKNYIDKINYLIVEDEIIYD